MQEWQQTGQKPEELEGPELPDYLTYLWEWYCELSRSEAGMSYQEVKAWSSLSGNRLHNWELQTLFKLYAEQVRAYQCPQTSQCSHSG